MKVDSIKIFNHIFAKQNNQTLDSVFMKWTPHGSETKIRPTTSVVHFFTLQIISVNYYFTVVNITIHVK